MATGIFAEDGPDLEWGGLTPHLAALLQVRIGHPCYMIQELGTLMCILEAGMPCIAVSVNPS